MALIEVKVPQLSESVSEATLLQWRKKPGQAVEMDEILVEIETDKVVLEVPAPASGVLAQIIKNDGDSCIAEEVIAKIDTEGQESVSGAMQIKSIPPAEPAPGETPGVPPEVAALAETKSEVAMPAAAKLMVEHDLPVGSVQGTGKGGRVTKGDVLEVLNAPPAAPASAAAAAKTAAPAPTAPATPAPRSPAAAPALLPAVAAPAAAQYGDRPEQRVPMSRLRARIAERLLQSQSTNAILTTFNEVNMAPVIDMRKRFQEKFEKEHGVKIGFMSFFVKAAVAALKRYPILNASVDGNDIVYHGYFDIGIAVGSPRGLVVPILRNADQMSFADIEKKIAEFGQKAKEGKLSLDDLTGGTFSISNGGVFGSMLSTPIINPPQAAILGVHATKDRAVVENGQIVVRPMNYLALSYDHRIIDGREAVLGLVAIKEALEDPARLLFDI
ncbi:MAG TPA: 2-oxoglutarate dehydrogenase complex dihydrolipoyllysine-residue succinyltransferase [Caldimonas sp.]|jgi:2-oxoglutarate dehydrogenase E2 component (dihydrolipoamide succinyltransferase)|nr:2-oxoglutarate dehydrogenase complex dihydrolipoyllysine-residue succinyltransferase [Caldimonas sp.]HEV7577514.1 2-oxoglutarate dehydrogenase complex dihydrolipoyllysine-residue succinyltransferase [Caldimonas sp.]